MIWQGYTIDYPLDLFQGKAIGPIDQLAVWPDYAMVTLSMNLNDEINQFEPATEDMLYWGGSVFQPYANTNVDTVATYNNLLNNLAIVKFNYGTGRVLLISPHPEIEEDSDRDGVNVAEELNDNGSDWNFLWTATDWLLGNPISEPAGVQLQTTGSGITIYPDPAKNVFNISTGNHQNIEQLTIYNQSGQNILTTKTIKNSIDLTGFQNGIYIVEIVINDQKIRKKLLVIK